MEAYKGRNFVSQAETLAYEYICQNFWAYASNSWWRMYILKFPNKKLTHKFLLPIKTPVRSDMLWRGKYHIIISTKGRG